MGQAGALIFAHENVRRRMSTEQFIEALNRKQEASPRGALPVVTFTDTVSFHLKNAYCKLGVHSKTEAVVKGLLAGILVPEAVASQQLTS